MSTATKDFHSRHLNISLSEKMYKRLNVIHIRALINSLIRNTNKCTSIEIKKIKIYILIITHLLVNLLISL